MNTEQTSSVEVSTTPDQPRPLGRAVLIATAIIAGIAISVSTHETEWRFAMALAEHYYEGTNTTDVVRCELRVGKTNPPPAAYDDMVRRCLASYATASD